MLNGKTGRLARTALLAVLVLAGVSTLLWGGVGLGRERSAAPVFGEPVNGLKIGLAISPMTWKPEGRIRFVCAFRNVSKKPIRVVAWGLELSQVLEVKESSGKVMKYGGGRDATRPMPADAFQTIQPGAIMKFSLTGRLMKNKMLLVNELLGGIWHWSLADGDYTVRAVFNRREDDEWMGRQARGPYWTGKAFSAPVKVSVGKRTATAGQAGICRVDHRVDLL